VRLDRAGGSDAIGHLENLAEDQAGDGVAELARVESADAGEDADAQCAALVAGSGDGHEGLT
jgi:tryptophan synthase beta subunit